MKNQKLHDEVKTLARIYLDSEKNLIGPLIQIKNLKAYRDFDYHGLDEYCVKQLGFTESVARMFQTVVNHARRLPQLREALEADRVTVTYASKIVSQLTSENVDEVLKFSQNHSIRETEDWLAAKHGRSQFKNFPLTVENIELLLEIRDTAPGSLSANEVLNKVLCAWRDKNHPVAKAKRAALKKAKKKPVDADKKASRTEGNEAPPVKAPAKNRTKIFSRKPLTADEVHTVNLRDGHRCTYRAHNGERCRETRWLHQHHIVLVSQGGSNDPENILTLCPEHHDLVHQLSFPLNDQQSWMQPPPH